MDKLSSAVRKVLLEKSSHASKQNKWSLKNLAYMNYNLFHENDNTIPSQNLDKALKENALALLEDVNVRLARQHKKCIDMIDQVSVENNEMTKTKTKNKDNIKDKGQGEKNRLIRAVNQPIFANNYNLEEWMQHMKIIEREKKNIKKGLLNLEVLHADTFALTYHLLANDKPTLTRFSKADKSLIAATFEQVRSRHGSTIENLADIVIGLKKIDALSSSRNQSSHMIGNLSIQKTLIESFLKERLGIQLLCDHYIGLNKGKPGGGISVNCCFMEVLTDAILEAKHVCDANLGIAPDVCILSRSHSESIHDNDSHDSRNSAGDQHLTLVRPWVHHALVEVLKNAMASSVERNLLQESSSNNRVIPPSIYIRVKRQCDQFLTCEIMDQGVGFNNEADGGIDKAFQFTQSSSGERWERLDEQQSYAMVRSPLGSLGVGLTLSQMMLNFFGGDLFLSCRSGGEQVEDDGSGLVTLDSGCNATFVLCTDPTVQEWGKTDIPS